MTRTRIFLDVDGVLNKIGRQYDYLQTEDRWPDFEEKKSGIGYLISFSPEMGKALRALDADIIWLTTWEHHANQYIGKDMFGWEEFPVLARDPLDHHDHGWWKSELLSVYIRENPGPFIWVDDDLPHAYNNNEVKWLKELDDKVSPHLLITPDPYVAVTREDIERMRNFITSLEGQTNAD